MNLQELMNVYLVNYYERKKVKMSYIGKGSYIRIFFPLQLNFLPADGSAPPWV